MENPIKESRNQRGGTRAGGFPCELSQEVPGSYPGPVLGNVRKSQSQPIAMFSYVLLCFAMCLLCFAIICYSFAMFVYVLQ